MFDAVYVLASALEEANVGTPLRPVNLSCHGNQAWAFGSSLYNYLNLVGVFCCALTGNGRSCFSS